MSLLFHSFIQLHQLHVDFANTSQAGPFNLEVGACLTGSYDLVKAAQLDCSLCNISVRA